MRFGVGLAVVVLIGVGAMGLAGCVPEPESSPSATMSPSASFVTPTPPAPLDTPEPTSPAPSASGDAAQVTIVTLDVEGGSVEATGIVAGITDADGVCTLVMTQGSRRATANAPATVANGVSYCPVISIATSDLGSGEWTATLEYRSSVHEGTTDRRIDLP
ncbi:hypothetical protein [uncultured Microbacterium sp.]|uniref:hypothetical protein n=1 Tax=uncultured Microbacterium sp. TaxID=191216 RepID=UPI0025E567FD|nr:hypothetical protein [uncultured Microbacterium sp.]